MNDNTQGTKAGRVSLLSGRTRLRFGLAVYALLWFGLVEFMSVLVNGRDLLVKERDIILLASLVLIEIINQVTYYLGRKHQQSAAVLKCILFWCAFSAGMGIYLLLLFRLEQKVTFAWHEELGWGIVYLVLAVTLPYYSLDTNFRFLLLHGRLVTTRNSK